ncbi:MAG: MarR family transcriptional regulator [Thermoproteota archaeon]
MKKTELSLISNLSSENFVELSALARNMNASVSQVSKTLKHLEEKGFIVKKRFKKRILVKLPKNPLVDLIKKVYKRYPKLLIGKKEVLLPHLLDFHDFSSLEAKTKLSSKQLSVYLKELAELGILEQTNGKFKLRSDLEELNTLAKLLRVYSSNVDLFESDSLVDGATLTGFSAYKNYGVKVVPYKYFYIKGKRKVSIEEVFVDSIWFAKNSNDLSLVSIFYLKNRDNMNFEKIYQIARSYGIQEKLALIPKFIRDNFEEIKEKAKLYGISIEESSRTDLENLFLLIDENLSNKARIFLIGGTNLVFRGLRSSTKDVDIVCEKESFYLVIEALRKVGFVCEGTTCTKGEKRVDIFNEKVFKGYFLTEAVKERSKLVWKGEKLEVFLTPLEFVFLLKSVTERDLDLDDCYTIAKEGLDWNFLFKEALTQQKKIKKIVLVSLVDTLDILKEKYSINVKIPRKIEKELLKLILLYVLSKKARDVKEIVTFLEKPESTVRKVLAELLREGRVKRIKENRRYIWKVA